ncbi:uncharacterized protein C18orf19 homolog A isoform X1 [Microplitis mediator]|uniref:uncharacterized protein C18orf19 homolog A isoform X1 n=1 Tax=Microplitis mediator TaxID=375433 RepID=UPI002552DD1D|nr:uncharacterized protein C18orf19 homolog A isoform X1 [Microplitis mediator]
MEIIIRRTSIINSILFKSFSNLRILSSNSVCPCEPTKWNFSNYNTKIPYRTFTKNFLPISSLDLLTNVKSVNLNNNELFKKFSNNVDKKKDGVPETDVNKGTSQDEPAIGVGLEKKNVFQKMKQLFKDYWYIMAPVHIATSTCWVIIFYIAAKNGVDVIPIMEYIMIPEKYINLIKNSGAGHWAVVYALYKLATPVRYTVTVGGTTMAIRYLDRMGYLKFKRPSSENIRKPSNRQRHQASAGTRSKKVLTQSIPKLTQNDKEKVINKI